MPRHHLQCRKHGHHVRNTVTADCEWKKRPTLDHQRQQDTIRIPHQGQRDRDHRNRTNPIGHAGRNIASTQSPSGSLRGSSCLFALQPDPICSCAPSTRRRLTNSQQPSSVVWRCLCKILSILPSCGAEDQARLPLWEGGFGLRSAQRTQQAAHWARWADAIKMVKDRHPSVAELIVSALEVLM